MAMALINTVRSLLLWQSKNFRRDFLYHHIRYEFQTSFRYRGELIIKILCLIALSTYIIIPNNIWLIPVIILVYLIYWWDLVTTLPKSWKLISNLYSFRSWIIVVLSIIILATLFVIVSLPISNIDISTGYQQLLAGINNFRLDGDFTPSWFSFLVLVSFIGISLDLASFAFTSFLVAITTPLAWYRRFVLSWTACQIRRNWNGKVVLITGSMGKSIITDLSSQIFKLTLNNTNLSIVPKNIHTPEQAAEALLAYAKPDTQFLLLSADIYNPKDAKAMVAMLKPQAMIIHAIGDRDIELAGSKKRQMEAYKAALSRLTADGVSILNASDSDCLKLAEVNQGNEILYYATTAATLPEIPVKAEPLILDVIQATKIIYAQRNTQFNFKTNDINLAVNVSGKQSHTIAHLLAALIVGQQAGATWENLIASLDQIQLPQLTTTAEGTNNSLLIFNANSSTAAGMVLGLQHLEKFKDMTNVLITKGLRGKQSNKKLQYTRLQDQFKDINVLITSDHTLAKIIRTTNEYVSIHLCRTDEDFIYFARQYLNPQSAVLLDGKVGDTITAALLSNK